VLDRVLEGLIDLQLFGEGENPNPNPNPAGGGSGSGGNNNPNLPPSPAAGKTFTEEYVGALRNESAGYRTQLRAAEKAVRDFLGLKSEDKLDDVSQALTAHRTASQQALEKATIGAKQFLVRAEVKVLAKDLGIVDSDAAMLLADLSKVQVADDGKVTGVKEALEALVKAKPYLAGKPGNTQVGSGSNPGPGEPADPVAAARKLAEERNKKPAPQGGFDPWAKQQ